MPYCMNCGQQLPDGARFCSTCGTPAGETSNNSQRQQEWAGRIVKCPMCGEDIPSFTGICPSCSHEINSARISPTLQSFVHEIDECDMQIASQPAKPESGWSSWSDVGKVIWIIVGFSTCCVSWLIYPLFFWVFPLIKNNLTHPLSDAERQKLSIIENCVVPNDRESILEMLMYIKSKIAFLNHGKADGRSAFWAKIWFNKAEHLNQKVEMMFPDDEIAQKTYIGIQNASKSLKRRSAAKAIIGVIILLIYLFPFLAFILSLNGENSDNSSINDYNSILEQETSETNCSTESTSVKVLTTTSTTIVTDTSITELTTNETTTESQSEETSTSLTTQVTTEPQSEETASLSSQTITTCVIEKNSVYTYMHDEWNLYVATAITDEIVQIERWEKMLSSSKAVSFESIIGTYEINDSENAFAWLDEEHTAFKFVLPDSGGWLSEDEIVVFTVAIDDSNKHKGSNYNKELACYSYTNDDWHMYRAIPLTENLMKIEAWCRSFAFGSYGLYGYDVCILDIRGTGSDFEWTDDTHTSFTVTLHDPKNKTYWKKPCLVVMSLENEDYVYSDVVSLLENAN